MPGQNMITSATLLSQIGAPDAPVLIDVCIDDDFALDPRLIPGAVRHPFTDIEALAPDLIDQQVVIICQKGLKLSQGAAALLRAQGIDAKALIGGMVQWAALDHPAIPAAALPKSRLIAAESPSPDALAALWLVRRFANRNADVLFVSENATEAVAEKFEATLTPAFADAIETFGLSTTPLRRLHSVLTGEAPEAAGVTALIAGLRALHPDDLSCLAASLPLFDALLRAFADASAYAEGAAA